MENSITQSYQQCIKTLLAAYEDLQSEETQMEVLFDDDRMRYMATWVGWRHSKRIHQCAIHIDIRDEMVVIQCNDTEDLIGTELANMGIPKEHICLGFLPPETQPYTTPDMIAKPYIPQATTKKDAAHTHV